MPKNEVIDDHEQDDDEGEAVGTAKEEPPEEPEAATKAEKVEDERLAEGGEAEQDQDKDDDNSQERHRETSKERRERKKRRERELRETNIALWRQNQEIMRRLANVEGRSLESQVLTVDSRLSECINDADQAERIELAAQKAGNDEDVRAARRLREEAQNRAGQLQATKDRLAQALTQQRNQPAPQAPPVGAEVIEHSARFRSDKPWIQFGPNNQPGNLETATAVSIDAALKAEGRISETEPRYWQELDKRVKAALPHLFRSQAEDDYDEDEDDDLSEAQHGQANRQHARRNPPVGTSSRNGAASRTVSRLSADRVAAIKEAGMWDDPKERTRAIKAYEKYDKQNARH